MEREIKLFFFTSLYNVPCLLYFYFMQFSENRYGLAYVLIS